MANESLVHSADVAGPATHVIVIGVGAYDHLAGGVGPQSKYSEGMGQLTSAPVSAVAFTDWVIRNFRDSKQLASVRLLGSGFADNRYTNPRTNVAYDVRPATLANAKAAIREWKEAGNTSTEHLLLFYFVGHGIAQGALQSLLMQDFGASDDAPLETAIDFATLHTGMSRCKARRQIYFIDACRAIPGTLLAGGKAGDPIIWADLKGFRTTEPCLAPIYYATLLGLEAYGRKGTVSVFTEALLRAFGGAGANNGEGTWRLQTTVLLGALNYFMQRASDTYEVLQMPNMADATSFSFHDFDAEPLLPVLLTCDPEAAHPHVVFNVQHPMSGRSEIKRGGPLETELSPGEYRIECTFPELPAGVAYRSLTLKPVLFPPCFNPRPLKVQA